MDPRRYRGPRRGAVTPLSSASRGMSEAERNVYRSMGIEMPGFGADGIPEWNPAVYARHGDGPATRNLLRVQESMDARWATIAHEFTMPRLTRTAQRAWGAFRTTAATVRDLYRGHPEAWLDLAEHIHPQLPTHYRGTAIRVPVRRFTRWLRRAYQASSSPMRFLQFVLSHDVTRAARFALSGVARLAGRALAFLAPIMPVLDAIFAVQTLVELNKWAGKSRKQFAKKYAEDIHFRADQNLLVSKYGSVKLQGHALTDRAQQWLDPTLALLGGLHHHNAPEGHETSVNVGHPIHKSGAMRLAPWIQKKNPTIHNF